jgi:hypothetical protein
MGGIEGGVVTTAGRKEQERGGVDYKITSEDRLGEYGQKQKYKDNTEARIMTINKIGHRRDIYR